ncbi:MAG TPA: addiction module protein [Kofleriaceae bacterium]|nr:addiction module protein [Kofleriaceae bacterium]
MSSAELHIRELLKLPLADRAFAARILLDSLDDEAEDPDAEALRAVALTGRAPAVAADTAELIDADEVRQRVAARLGSARS